MRNVIAGLRLAVGTLTVVPVGAIGDPTRAQAGWAMSLAPLAALPLGAAAAATVAISAAAGLPDLVGGLLVVGVIGLLTRGMHLDGLADTVDGLGAGWEQSRALEVMRRGDVGPMGGASLVVVVGLQAAAVAALIDRPGGWLLVGATVAVSRWACALTCARPVPAARPGGMGALVAGSVPVGAVAVITALLAGTVMASGAVAGLSVWAGTGAVGGATLAVLLLLRTCLRVFGGVTGDVIGAGIEVALTTMLVILSADVW